MADTPNPKCSKCKCYWKPDETDIKSSGLQCKTCKKCRERVTTSSNKSKCEHNVRKSRCRKCDGKDICIHDRRISYCVECGGSEICHHNKIKSQCKDCGNSICSHNKRKTRCKDCCGGSICPHNKIKYHCKMCNLQLYLVNLQRNHLKRCLKLSNLEKTKPSIEYLGCSAEYFIEYFKKKMDNFNQFSEIEMTWDNIHIDHIKPVASFNLDDEEEFLSCCNYTNLQPLIVEDNLNKSCKWSDEDNTYWIKNIKDKEYYDIYMPV